MTQSRLSLPGCHVGTGSRAPSGRSIVILDDIPPTAALRVTRGALRKPDKKKSKTGKRIMGRASAILNFSSNPITSPFSSRTDRERVQYLLQQYRELVQHLEEDGKSRPDWQAYQVIKQRHGDLLMENTRDRQKHISGVEIGDIFRSRRELCLVGLHKQIRAGIASEKIVDTDGQTQDIAVSVVSSGGYEDDDDRGDTLRYTGEGGNDPKSKRQIKHQQMIRGNLALVHSFNRQESVRVCRDRPSERVRGKIEYSYDGLYKVESWEKKPGKSKFMVFTFVLVREANQLPL